MHYDDIHFQKWRDRGSRGSKPTKRQSEFKVLRCVVVSHQKKQCQRIALPQRVKALYRNPKDEESWDKLKAFRLILRDMVQGQRYLALASEEEAQDLAMAIENCPRHKQWNTVGEGFPGIPAGSEIQARKPECNDVVRVRRLFADSVRRMEPGTTVEFYSRPWDANNQGKNRNPIMDSFVKLLFKDEEAFDMKRVAATAPRGPYDVLGCFERMLLVCWDALHLDMAETWAKKRVANVRANDCPELARYFLRGLGVGCKPLMDSMCSFCACLLYDERQEGGMRTAKTAPPIDREGGLLKRADGSPDIRAQPPALLRCTRVFLARVKTARRAQALAFKLAPGIPQPSSRKRHRRCSRTTPPRTDCP